MSTPKPGDRDTTIDLLRSIRPEGKGITWLGHSVNQQSGCIDLMLLTGDYTKEEMAEALSRRYGERPLNEWVRRINAHFAHLQDGDRRDRSSSMKPHRLKLKEEGGKWTFDLDD
ncbi:MAG: hypothetical protein K9M82_01645 [Deltaproteobacteria bacterium]|nr:hypothetical protein [Deltaproteobacteria bacterium]